MSETFLRAARVRAVDALGDEEDGTSCSVRMARLRMLINSEDEEVAERARATLQQLGSRQRIIKEWGDIGKEGIPNCSAGPVKKFNWDLFHWEATVMGPVRDTTAATMPMRSLHPVLILHSVTRLTRAVSFFSTFNSLRCIPSSRQRCNSPQRSTIQTSTSTVISAWEFWGLSGRPVWPYGPFSSAYPA